MLLRPPISTLFPYTTLFRSIFRPRLGAVRADLDVDRLRDLDLLADRLHDLPLNRPALDGVDRKSTRLNSSHVSISYAVFCLKKKINNIIKLKEQRVYYAIYH